MSSTLNRGQGLENKRTLKEKQICRPSSLKNEKIRMRANDFGTPLVLCALQVCVFHIHAPQTHTQFHDATFIPPPIRFSKRTDY